MSIARTSLREQIKELVIERILDGTYGPGDRIVELQLAQEFGTSQAPVREALRDLEALRFIVSEPYRGARVRLVTTEELAETYPVRASLEELGGQLAAVNASAETLQELESIIEAMRECAAAGDVHGQLAHDARFHEVIVEAADNEVLLDAWRSLRIEARTLVSVVSSTDDLLVIAESHRPILEALAERDALLAGRRLREHIEYYLHQLLQRDRPGR